MSVIRRRRLRADRERLERAFSDHRYIRVLKALGTPPDRYQVEFRIIGLEQRGEQVIKRDRHLAEVYLTTDYPKQAPQCRMLTPCFHPNIDHKAICVGDHWAAGESLANLITRIGEIISYQSYNTKSPLNGEAARWCDTNRHMLPVDTSDLRPESLSDAEAQAIRKQPEPKKVLKAKLVRNTGPTRPRAERPRQERAPRPAPARKVLKAKLVRKEPDRGGAATGQAPGAPVEVQCTCGRRYRPRRMRPFNCMACGKMLQPGVR